jgi:hypothetical protein
MVIAYAGDILNINLYRNGLLMLTEDFVDSNIVDLIYTVYHMNVIHV